MTGLGTPVRFLRSIYHAEDETCFFLYAAESQAAVREAAGAAGRPVDHVIQEPLTY
jgi:hypothetical protein